MQDPGNHRCVDCGTINPLWASLSYGSCELIDDVLGTYLVPAQHLVPCRARCAFLPSYATALSAHFVLSFSIRRLLFGVLRRAS